MNDLRFPIGKFHFEGAPSEQQKQQFLAEIAQAPLNLRSAVQGLSDAQLDTAYRPEGWTIRQVVHHVPDSHLNSYIRFKLALTEDAPTIRPYAQGAWAEISEARTGPLPFSLNLLDALHERWVRMLAALTPEQWLRTYRHPESGV